MFQTPFPATRLDVRDPELIKKSNQLLRELKENFGSESFTWTDVQDLNSSLSSHEKEMFRTQNVEDRYSQPKGYYYQRHLKYLWLKAQVEFNPEDDTFSLVPSNLGEDDAPIHQARQGVYSDYTTAMDDGSLSSDDS